MPQKLSCFWTTFTNLSLALRVLCFAILFIVDQHSTESQEQRFLNSEIFFCSKGTENRANLGDEKIHVPQFSPIFDKFLNKYQQKLPIFSKNVSEVLGQKYHFEEFTYKRENLQNKTSHLNQKPY